MHPGVHSPLLRFTRLTALAVLVATFAGLLSKEGLVFELLCHFRVQYLLLALGAAVIFARFRRWGWLSFMLAAIVVNGAGVLPWYLGGDRQLVAGKASITVLQSNLYSGNENLGDLLSLVHAEAPDLLAVQELSVAGVSQLGQLSQGLPYTFLIPRDDNFGIGLYSKWPIVDKRFLQFGGMGLPTIEARVDMGAKLASVIVVHPPPPVSDALYRERNRYLQELTEYVAKQRGAVIVIGDLNSSMWSGHYRSLEEGAGLRNARTGFGVLPTWPAGFAPMGLPLDHCLVSQDLVVDALRVGPDIGSDHLPLIARFRFAESKKPNWPEGGADLKASK